MRCIPSGSGVSLTQLEDVCSEREFRFAKKFIHGVKAGLRDHSGPGMPTGVMVRSGISCGFLIVSEPASVDFVCPDETNLFKFKIILKTQYSVLQMI